MSFIYSLTINDYPIYIGKTKNIKNRYNNHKSACYSGDDKKLYTTINQMGISRRQFYEYVKINILYENVPKHYEDRMEFLTIFLYRDFGFNIFNQRVSITEYLCQHNKIKMSCSICNPSMCNKCNKVYSKGYIKTHLKNCKF